MIKTIINLILITALAMTSAYGQEPKDSGFNDPDTFTIESKDLQDLERRYKDTLPERTAKPSQNKESRTDPTVSKRIDEPLPYRENPFLKEALAQSSDPSERCRLHTVTAEDAMGEHFVRLPEIDIDASIEACSRAVDAHRSKENLFGLGRAFLAARKYPESFKALKASAEMEYGSAQYLVGRMCQEELVEDRMTCRYGGNLEIDWHIKALRNGNRKAMDLLRLSYYDTGYRKEIKEAFKSVPAEYGFSILVHYFTAYQKAYQENPKTTQYLEALLESGYATGFAPTFRAGHPDPPPIGDDPLRQQGEFLTLLAYAIGTINTDDGSGGWVRDRQFLQMKRRAERLLHAQDPEIRQQSRKIMNYADREFQGPSSLETIITIFSGLAALGELMPDQPSSGYRSYKPPVTITDMLMDFPR